MTKSDRICDFHEEICDNNLKFLNGKTNWFKTLDKQPRGSRIDYLGVDRIDRPVNLELKTRTCHINSFETIFQDVRKMKSQLTDSVENDRIPLYINFMQTERFVWLVDLSTLDLEDLEVKTIMVWNAARGCKVPEQKYCIPTRLGHYYEYEESTDSFVRKW